MRRQLVVRDVVVDVFRFQFQIQCLSREDCQDYLYDVEFVDDMLFLNWVNRNVDRVLVADVDFVRVKLNGTMMNVHVHLLEMDIHS